MDLAVGLVATATTAPPPAGFAFATAGGTAAMVAGAFAGRRLGGGALGLGSGEEALVPVLVGETVLHVTLEGFVDDAPAVLTGGGESAQLDALKDDDGVDTGTVFCIQGAGRGVEKCGNTLEAFLGAVDVERMEVAARREAEVEAYLEADALYEAFVATWAFSDWRKPHPSRPSLREKDDGSEL